MLPLFLLLAGVVAVVTLVLWVLHHRPRLQVSRATLRQDGLDTNSRLVRTVSRMVLPVRLVGVGGAARRLDLGLVEERPDLDVGGLPAKDLAPLVGGRAYFVLHPVYAEIWLRTGFRSVRRVVALPRTELFGDIEFIRHDPDGIGSVDDRYRGSVGTIQIPAAPRTSLYLEVLVEPSAARPGPGATHPEGFA